MYIFVFNPPVVHCGKTKMAFASEEHRPIKKPRLGVLGPDVYPQDPRQKEVGIMC